MWTKGNSNLWPNEPPRNGLALPVGVSAAVRIPGRTLPGDCEKKRERGPLFCFQSSNRSNGPAMMATYSSSPHRDWPMAAVCCRQATFTVRVDLPECPRFWGVFPEVWTWRCICSLQRIFYCPGLEQFNTRRSWL